jgi:hypothetical protein
MPGRRPTPRLDRSPARSHDRPMRGDGLVAASPSFHFSFTVVPCREFPPPRRGCRCNTAGGHPEAIRQALRRDRSGLDPSRAHAAGLAAVQLSVHTYLEIRRCSSARGPRRDPAIRLRRLSRQTPREAELELTRNDQNRSETTLRRQNRESRSRSDLRPPRSPVPGPTRTQ